MIFYAQTAKGKRCITLATSRAYGCIGKRLRVVLANSVTGLVVLIASVALHSTVSASEWSQVAKTAMDSPSINERLATVTRLELFAKEEPSVDERKVIELACTSALADLYVSWKLGIIPIADEHADEIRLRGLALLDKMIDKEQAGQSGWAEIRLRQALFALNDLEVIELLDIPDVYVRWMPQHAATLRTKQVDACLRSGELNRAIEIANLTLDWPNDTDLLGSLREQNRDVSELLRSVQAIAVSVLAKVPQLDATPDERLAVVDRLASKSAAPQVLGMAEMARKTIQKQTGAK